MGISETAKLNISIKEDFGIVLDPTLQYSKEQLLEIHSQLKEMKSRLEKGIKKEINLSTNACMGGEIEAFELNTLVDKILKLAYPQVK